MKNIELNKVFITNIAEHPNNGSLLLRLASINDYNDLAELIKNPQEECHLLKLFLNTETQSLGFQGVELDSIIKIKDEPFNHFKVLICEDANLFVFISDVMTFNFMSPLDDSYQFLLNFLIEQHFDILVPEMINDSTQLKNNRPVYLN